MNSARDSFPDMNNHARILSDVTIGSVRVIRFEIEIAFEKESATTARPCPPLPTSLRSRDEQRANKRRSAGGVVEPQEKDDERMEVLFCLISPGVHPTHECWQLTISTDYIQQGETHQSPSPSKRVNRKHWHNKPLFPSVWYNTLG